MLDKQQFHTDCVSDQQQSACCSHHSGQRLPLLLALLLVGTLLWVLGKGFPPHSWLLVFQVFQGEVTVPALLHPAFQSLVMLLAWGVAYTTFHHTHASINTRKSLDREQTAFPLRRTKHHSHDAQLVSNTTHHQEHENQRYPGESKDPYCHEQLSVDHHSARATKKESDEKKSAHLFQAPSAHGTNSKKIPEATADHGASQTPSLQGQTRSSNAFPKPTEATTISQKQANVSLSVSLMEILSQDDLLRQALATRNGIVALDERHDLVTRQLLDIIPGSTRNTAIEASKRWSHQAKESNLMRS